MNHPLINSSWKNADALLRVNKKDIPILKQFNKNVYPISNGFSPRFEPLDKYECRKKLNLPTEYKILFSLGWLIERKGFNYLIDAMKIITAKRNDVLCFIGGSSPSEDELRNKVRNNLQKQIEDLKLQERVKLIGAVQDNLLPLWMNASDIFVLPSLGEGNPVVMFEALGCGKPFVGTKVGGVPEIIISEDYGFLCDPAKSVALADNILLALTKEWNCGKIEEYSKQFTWDSVARNILEIYSKVEIF
jgi:glycosyltransferase involved in cell wall biosynthesis